MTANILRHGGLFVVQPLPVVVAPGGSTELYLDADRILPHGWESDTRIVAVLTDAVRHRYITPAMPVDVLRKHVADHTDIRGPQPSTPRRRITRDDV